VNAVAPLHLFEGFGVELEYMIVDAASLNVRPLAEAVLRASADAEPDDIEFEDVSWSNELVSHVIELKTSGPAARLEGLAARFGDHVGRVEARLAAHGARLLPTAMHPWMDPARETKIWPHGAREIYETYDRIFGCKGHGWANLQCVHLNLPFAGDDEFGRLHAAIRAVLPILPALAASSPYVDGQSKFYMLDTRLFYYLANQHMIPSIAGEIIPEPVYTRAEYERHILAPIYRDMALSDPDGILRHEWLNSRGAIARFERDTIEIRLLDIQECPAADLAIVALIAETIRALAAERWAPLARLQALAVKQVETFFLHAMMEGDEAAIDSREYLDLFGWSGPVPCRARELWRHLAAAAWPGGAPAEWREPLRVILDQGCLARRILRGVGAEPKSPFVLPVAVAHPPRERLHEVYSALADCLRGGRMFEA
jgi:gamma-glutamyl:cysteine ligase YbdK (ATP-grasp superfamily)